MRQKIADGHGFDRWSDEDLDALSFKDTGRILGILIVAHEDRAM
jgi:hypothetical protein